MKRALLLALLFFSAAARADTPDADPIVEARTMRLAAELRCLVCQNQSLADSNADLALDLRNQIREQIAAGRSDEQINDYMVERYGDFVLYRPPFKSKTLLLWLGPFALVLLGLYVLLRNLRARRAQMKEPTLSEDEHRAAQALLAGEEERR